MRPARIWKLSVRSGAHEEEKQVPEDGTNGAKIERWCFERIDNRFPNKKECTRQTDKPWEFWIGFV
jgi:hypothetical protein